MKKSLLSTLLLAALSLVVAPLLRADEKADDKVTFVSFSKLSNFEFEIPESDNPNELKIVANSMVPDSVKQYDGKNININGYMIPLKWEKSDVVEFLVVANTLSCCYGQPPKFNEIILTKMKGKGVKPLMDSPIFFQGRLKVGAVIEDGGLAALFSMECESVTP